MSVVICTVNTKRTVLKVGRCGFHSCFRCPVSCWTLGQLSHLNFKMPDKHIALLLSFIVKEETLCFSLTISEERGAIDPGKVSGCQKLLPLASCYSLYTKKIVGEGLCQEETFLKIPVISNPHEYHKAPGVIALSRAQEKTCAFNMPVVWGGVRG